MKHKVKKQYIKLNPDNTVDRLFILENGEKWLAKNTWIKDIKFDGLDSPGNEEQTIVGNQRKW